MKLLVDNQLPPALARFLAGLGSQAQHVLDVGLERSKDSQIWTYAVENQIVLVTKDQDFLRFLDRAPGGQMVWIRLGNCRSRVLLDTFARMWPSVQSLLTAAERLVEIR